MKITRENYKDWASEDKQAFLLSLISDVEEDNNNHLYPKNLEIHVDEYHTEYSPERVDPCPDFYGTFSLYWEDRVKTGDNIYSELDLDGLDLALAIVHFAFETLNETK